MSDILFSGKLICKDCSKKMKGKKARNNRVYICSTYDRGLDCTRKLTSQQELLELCEMRYKRLLTKEEIETLIDHILISENSIEIYLHHDKPIKLLENYAQF